MALQLTADVYDFLIENFPLSEVLGVAVASHRMSALAPVTPTPAPKASRRAPKAAAKGKRRPATKPR